MYTYLQKIAWRHDWAGLAQRDLIKECDWSADARGSNRCVSVMDLRHLICCSAVFALLSGNSLTFIGAVGQEHLCSLKIPPILKK